MHKMLATVALVLGLAADLTGQSPTLHAWGGVERGLRLGVSATARPEGDVAFDIVVENVGSADFVLRLGTMLANGKVMWPDAIRLEITDSGGAVTTLRFFDRRYPVIGGRLDDYLVGLRGSSRIGVVTTLADYALLTTSRSNARLTPGRYRVKALLEATGAASLNSDTPGIALLNFWLGTLASGSSEMQIQ